MANTSLREEFLEIILSVRADFISRRLDADIDEIVSISQALEAMRVMLIRSDDDYLTEKVSGKLRDYAAAILGNPVFLKFAERTFRLRGPRSERAHPLRHASDGKVMTVFDAITYLSGRIKDVGFQPEFEFDKGRKRRSGGGLAGLVPEQKVAPAQFSIEDDFLAIQHVPATALQRDQGVASSARAILIEQGRIALENLRNSNCDIRFFQQVEDLQRKLEATEDVVQLGIVNLACEDQRQQFEKELPDAVGAQLRSHFTSISFYVAQFPDWQRFTDNAAIVELNERDIRKAQSVAIDVIARLEQMPDRVAPEVPRTIRLINDAITDPRNTSKRAAFALFRTLENLFSKIFGYAGTFADELISQSSAKIAKWGAGSIAVIFVKAVLEGAGVLAPIYARMPDAAWITNALEIIKQISI